MKFLVRLLLVLLAFAPVAFAATATNCGCTCCKEKPLGEACCCVIEVAQAAPVKSHPLRGVVTAVNAESSTLMVKHETIPGVMRAMTMMFKVDPEVVKRVKQGETITAKMSRVNDEWRLDDVRVAAPGSI